MRLANGIETHDKPIKGIDWSRTKGVEVYDPITDTTLNFKTFEEAAVAFPHSFFVLESTGESYELQRRQIVLDAFETYDITAYCFKTQRTAWFRKAWSLSKSNAGDAKVIYRIATETKLALHMFKQLVENDPIRDEIRKFLVEDRFLHDGAQSEAVAEKYLDTVQIPSEYKLYIYSGKNYRKQVGRFLALAEIVRQHGRGYREFRRQIGNYSNGYGSMPRSEFYHWWTRMVTNARLDRHVAKALNQLTDEQKLIHRQVLKEATIVARWLWRLTA